EALDDQLNPSTLGPELLANPDFDGNADGWVLGSNVAYTDHAVVVDMSSSQDDGETYQYVALEPGKRYRVTFTISDLANDTAIVWLNGECFDTGSRHSAEISTNGTHSFDFSFYGDNPTEGAQRFNIGVDAFNYNAGAVFTLTSVSVKELVGASVAAYQPFAIDNLPPVRSQIPVYAGRSGKKLQNSQVDMNDVVVRDHETGDVTLNGNLTVP